MELLKIKKDSIRELKYRLAGQNSYTIVVLDDDRYFNQLVSRRVKYVAADIGRWLKKDVVVLSYEDAEKFLNDLYLQKFRVTNLILFLDFQLSDKLNGLFIIEKLKSYRVHPVVFVFSDNHDKEFSHVIKEAGALLYMRKNNYTPDVCQELLNELFFY